MASKWYVKITQNKYQLKLIKSRLKWKIVYDFGFDQLFEKKINLKWISRARVINERKWLVYKVKLSNQMMVKKRETINNSEIRLKK